jgi:hypothetical protein
MTQHPDLPPPPWRDFPPGRQEFHKQRLMSVIDQETRIAPTPARPRRQFWLIRPVFALPALALIVVGATAIVATRHDTGGGTSQAITEPAQFADPHAGSPRGVAQLANRMALVAKTRENKPAPTGGWVYIKNKTTEFYVAQNDDTHTRTLTARASIRQVWTSRDGKKGWLIQSGIRQKEGGETLDSDAGGTLNGPSYELLAALPTDPDALLSRIYRETRGQGTGPDSEAFVTIGDLLGESYPPAKLYPALYRAAAKIPGVLVVDDVVDATGRHGIALARVDESGLRQELIFDKTDYTFLGSREVRTNDLEEIKAGTVTFSSAILQRALVDRMKQIPAA